MPILLFILGISAGVLSGMFGIGGGIVIVPALVTLFGQLFPNAVAASLTALMMPVNLFAVIAYYRAGKLKIRVAALIAVGLVFGGLLGAEVALNLPVTTMQRLYALFLLYESWRFIEPRKWLYERRTDSVVTVATPEAPLTLAWYFLLLVGVVAGIVSGMFGVGGGIVMVPALVSLLRFDQRLAVGTSLAAMLPPVTFASVISYYQSGLLDVPMAMFIALGLVGGSFAGAKIALGLPEKTVKRLYGLFLLVVALRFLLQP